VDPLDGTKEFIKRWAEFTANVALIEDGQPVLGVVLAPALDLLYFYWAVKGGGSLARGEWRSC
jgi:3'(2'), 5'-bisphosphate nucleotidase